MSFLKMEQDESPLARLAVESIHVSKQAEVWREHLEHSVSMDAEVLGEHLAREVKLALERDREENEGLRPRRPGGKR